MSIFTYFQHIGILEGLNGVLILLHSVALTGLTASYAYKLGLTDPTGPKKFHKEPTPRLGGIPIFTSVIFGVIILYAFQNIINFSEWKIISFFFLGGFSIFITGLIDDLKGMRASSKLAGQILSVVLSIIPFIIFNDMNLGDKIFLLLVSIPLMLIVINSINLIDGLNGLATGLGIICCISLYVILGDDKISSIIIFSLIISLVGFLFFNFPKAKIFLGDSGSNFIGYIFAFLIFNYLEKAYTKHEVSIVSSYSILVVGFCIPIADLLLAVIRRTIILSCSNVRDNLVTIVSGDLQHIHYRLERKFNSSVIAVMFIWFIQISIFTFLYNSDSSRYLLLSSPFLFILFFWLVIDAKEIRLAKIALPVVANKIRKTTNTLHPLFPILAFCGFVLLSIIKTYRVKISEPSPLIISFLVIFSLSLVVWELYIIAGRRVPHKLCDTILAVISSIAFIPLVALPDPIFVLTKELVTIRPLLLCFIVLTISFLLRAYRIQSLSQSTKEPLPSKNFD